MKYFTRELIEMGQSRDDAVLDRQDALWEEVCERFEAYLDSVRGEMPPGLRQRWDNYYLRDARIRGVGQRGRSFLILLQLDTPPESLVSFTYDLVEDPVIDKAALSPESCSTGDRVDWLYDEIEPVGGAPPTWVQSILLSNGWELRLHFRDVRVEETPALIPAPHYGSVVSLPPSITEPA
jgi:hypothetical protein